MIAVVYQKAPYAIYSLQTGANVTRPEQLQGLQIASGAGSATPKIITGFMRDKGLDTSKVQFTNVDGAARVSMLLTEKVPAIETFILGQPGIERGAGDKKVATFLLADHGLELYSSGILSTEAFLKANPDVAKAFVAASMRGWKDALANPEEAAKLMIEQVKALAPEAVVAELRIVRDLAITPDVQAKGFRHHRSAEIRQGRRVPAQERRCRRHQAGGRCTVLDRLPACDAGQAVTAINASHSARRRRRGSCNRGARQDFPNRPIKLILTNPPGGTVGILARVISEGLTKRLGQPVIIEPKPGANGNTAAEAVIRSDPDGYTLLVSPAGPYTTNKLIFSSTSYDPQRAFAPVSIVAVAPLVLVVHPSTPIKSFDELLAFARANPGKLSYSAQGFGATGHLAMELLKSMTGIDVVHITYQGSAQAMVDLLAGRVALAFDNTTTAMPHIQAGTLRALAVAEPQRIKALPDVPTVSEAGVPGFCRKSVVRDRGAGRHARADRCGTERRHSCDDDRRDAQVRALPSKAWTCAQARRQNSARTSRARRAAGRRFSARAESSRVESQRPIVRTVANV